MRAKTLSVVAVLFLCSQTCTSQSAETTQKSPTNTCKNCSAAGGGYFQLCDLGCQYGFYRHKQVVYNICDDPNSKQKSSNASEADSSTRRRRQVAETVITTIATTPTTTPIPLWKCNSCSVQHCNKCRDGTDAPQCESCFEGYQLNNETKDCTFLQVKSDSNISSGAIAAIIVVVICITGIVFVILFFVKRRQSTRDVSVKLESGKSRFPDGRSEQSVINEKRELDDLPLAPNLPVEDHQYHDMAVKRYEALDAKTMNIQAQYTPFEDLGNTGQNDLYMNTATAENVYANAPSHTNIHAANLLVGSTPNSAINKPNHLQPQESTELYEPIEAGEPQEIYANDKSSLLAEKHIEEETYMNEDATEDFYQNT